MSRRATVLVIAAIAAYVLATLAWVAGDKRAERAAFENPGSSLDRTAAGTSLARALLKERAGAAGRVEALLRRVDLEELPADAVVFRIGPPVAPFLGRWTEDQEGSKKGEKPGEKGESPPSGGKKDGKGDQPKGEVGDEKKGAGDGKKGDGDEGE
ncbi:MAG TPA: hypothetical protein VN851_01145, partial [Thermoanaerobaculia bacterium]|nr:hypothetical protein [Thermoanaerobaculia bacterium]